MTTGLQQILMLPSLPPLAFPPKQRTPFFVPKSVVVKVLCDLQLGCFHFMHFLSLTHPQYHDRVIHRGKVAKGSVCKSVSKRLVPSAPGFGVLVKFVLYILFCYFSSTSRAFSSCIIKAPTLLEVSIRTFPPRYRVAYCFLFFRLFDSRRRKGSFFLLSATRRNPCNLFNGL